MTVKFAEKNIELIGKKPTIKINDEIRNAKLSNNKLQIVELKEYFNKNKIVILSTFPSIDTTTCDIQTTTLIKKYNDNEKVLLINISEDLPFAQNRWCSTHNSKNAIVLSDYNLHSFGNEYGLFLSGINLLARTVMIIVNKKIVYIDIVDEVSNNIDFDKLEKNIQKYL